METSWTLPVPKHKFSDLYLCFCGYEACQPFHSYGPAVRPNYVIHYIISGKGTFTIGNRTYRLTAGQGFFLILAAHLLVHIPDQTAHQPARQRGAGHHAVVKAAAARQAVRTADRFFSFHAVLLFSARAAP